MQARSPMQARWRTLYDAHGQLASTRARVERTCRWLDQVLTTCRSPYVSFSGGKDSLAVLGLMCCVRPASQVVVVTQADDLDWPWKRAYCHRVIAQLGITDYEYCESTVSARDQLVAGAARIRGTFRHVLRAYAQRRGHDAAILGLRAAESRGRQLSRARRGRDYRTREGLRHLLPLADWSALDVMAWIQQCGLPLAPVYEWDDDGVPPHERRMSWPVMPDLMAHGEARLLQRHEPGLWNALVAAAPHLTRDQ